MPTKREREYYRMGYDDGIRSGRAAEFMRMEGLSPQEQGKDIARGRRLGLSRAMGDISPQRITRPKRKLSAWNKFVKANSKKKIYRFANGKLKLKKMGIAFRKTRAGRKR